MTNGDRIRAMSDDALSLWLAHFGVDYAKLVIEYNVKPPLKFVINEPTEKGVLGVAQSILKLLKEEAQVDG